jgi:nitrogen-specific signal transduction histidine kinase
MTPAPVHPLPPTTTAARAGLDAATEVERLRTLLDKQPSCVMRVAANGRLLAVNEAAVSLLGARALVDVLGAMFTERLIGDGTAWADFVRRVSQAGSASTECEMSDLAGVERAVIMQGVAMPDHPDGEESLLVAVRDVSTAKRLQVSLQEQEDSVRELRMRLDEIAAERDRLRGELDAADADREQLTAALDQLKAALNTAIDATLLAQQVTAKGPRP